METVVRYSIQRTILHVQRWRLVHTDWIGSMQIVKLFETITSLKSTAPATMPAMVASRSTSLSTVLRIHSSVLLILCCWIGSGIIDVHQCLTDSLKSSFVLYLYCNNQRTPSILQSEPCCFACFICKCALAQSPDDHLQAKPSEFMVSGDQKYIVLILKSYYSETPKNIVWSVWLSALWMR